MSVTNNLEILTPSFNDLTLNTSPITTTSLTPTTNTITPPITNTFTPFIPDDAFSARDPAIDFEILRIRDLDHRNFSRSLHIVSWNCRGIQNKYHSIHNIFRVTGADILVLNETFRLPGVPWPSSLPPCIAEATNSGSSITRLSNGVAVLANPDSLGLNGNIRTFSVLNVDNTHGLRVTVKVNNLTILGVYAPTSIGNDFITEVLTEANRLQFNQSPVVLCGDLNVTPIDATPTIRSRINHFYNNLGANFLRADTGDVPTRPANRVDSVNTVGNTLDHFFGAHVQFDLSMCMHGLNHTSDHHPIITRVTPVRPFTDTSIRYWRLNTAKLSDPHTKDAYAQAIETALPVLRASIASAIPADLDRSSSSTLKQQAVNQIELAFVSTITNIAASIVGRKPVKLLHSRRPVRESAEYQQIHTELDIIFNNLLRYSGVTPTPPRVQEWLLRRDQLRDHLRALDLLDHSHAYREWVQSFCGLSVSQRLKILNRTMRRRSAAGSCLSSTPDALDSYKMHFQGQFTNTFGIAPFDPTPIPIDRLTDFGLATSSFPTSLILEKLSISPTGKAPGLTGLSAELLRPIAPLVAPLLGSIFCSYMTLSFVPSSWKRALICPVPKKGDLSLISNYRPISLIEVTRKIFEMCLLDQIQSDVRLSREQGGFRPGRSTLDQVACLDKLIKLSRSQGKHTHMAFLDIKAAYDSVPRGELWRRCHDLGMNYLLLDILRALFDHNSAQLVLSQKRSQPFSLPAGVLQGSVLSPILYSIFLDPFVSTLSHGPKLSLPNQFAGINCLLYADDIVLIANTPYALNRLLRLAELDSTSRGYRFSPTKCVIVSPGHALHSIYGSSLERYHSFCYLGFIITSRGLDFKKHIQVRVKKADAYGERLHLAGARWRNFPAYINVQLYAAFIRPGLEYGLQLIPPNHSTLTLLQQCQKRILCRFLGVNVNARNDIIDATTNCPSIVARQSILQHRRVCKLLSLWPLDDSNEFAFIFASRGIDGDSFIAPVGFDPRLTPDNIRTLVYIEPIMSSLRLRFQNHLPISTLRWLLRLRIGHGLIRLLLLWTLRRWNIFGRARQCLRCQQSFREQSHVVVCCSLHDMLATHPTLVTFPNLESTGENCIEAVMTFLSHSEQSTVPDSIEFIAATICSCLTLVFGANAI